MTVLVLTDVSMAGEGLPELNSPSSTGVGFRSTHPTILDKGISLGVKGYEMGKKKLNQEQRVAIEEVWRYGLNDAQIKLVNALDNWFDEYPQGPTLRQMQEMAELAFGTVHISLAVLEYFGYVNINRDRKGRIVPGGIVLIFGFDMEKDA